jgi:hypothetical protein
MKVEVQANHMGSNRGVIGKALRNKLGTWGAPKERVGSTLGTMKINKKITASTPPQRKK